MTLKNQRNLIITAIIVSVISEIIFWKLLSDGVLFGTRADTNELPLVALNSFNGLSTVCILVGFSVYQRMIRRPEYFEKVAPALLYLLFFIYVLAEFFVSVITLVFTNVDMTPRFG